YGHTAPLSDGGKAFCIVYSVLGIPFTLLFLTAVVQRIMIFSTRRPVMYVSTRWGLSKPLVAMVHATLLAILAASCFFLIPAAIFSSLEENWNFLESFYFCFISLSTIGLGDYVPGESFNQRFRQLYKKEKPQDHLAILEHDHLAFTSVSHRNNSTSLREDNTFVSVPELASPGGDDPMIG
ncbi:unnamed protein product, partial [Coregonus sp. 'balchen']